MELKTIAVLLMTWIGENSAYDVSCLPLPDIVEMTPTQLTAEAYADVPHLRPADGVDERVIALYSFDEGPSGTIYVLAPQWAEGAEDGDPRDNPVFQEWLLHELVHHVQRVSGAYAAFPCRNFGEKEAYLMGGRFLKQRYADDPLPNRNFWAHVYSRC